MNTKEIALVIAFSAVTVVLNPRFSGIAIPSFVPTLWFQVWEIAVITALFLLGMKSAIVVAVLNTVVLQAISPGTSFNQPIVNLIAILSTLLGVYAAYKLLNKEGLDENQNSKQKIILLSSILGILSRLAIMLPFLFIAASLMRIPLIIEILPLFAIYDLIVALYSIPIGYLVANVVNKYVEINSKI